MISLPRLNKRDRAACAPVAPPDGLYLVGWIIRRMLQSVEAAGLADCDCART